jgi:hypothetical protein
MTMFSFFSIFCFRQLKTSTVAPLTFFSVPSVGFPLPNLSNRVIVAVNRGHLSSVALSAFSLAIAAARRA